MLFEKFLRGMMFMFVTVGLVAIGAGVGSLLLPVSVMPETVSYTPCATEDSVPTDGQPCIWDAPMSGNGIGKSFIVFPDGSVVRIEK